METFLKEVAHDLYKKTGGNFADIAVIFPNKRAGLFFNEYLSQETSSPMWSPVYMSISEFFCQLSDWHVGDSVKLVCDLYKVFCEITGSKETLDDFYFWGEMLIADFDDANDESLINLPHYDFDCEEYDSGNKAVQDAVSDNDCIRLKMKNRKEILEDNTCAYDEAMQRFGLLAAYKTNCEYADSSPMTPEGELVCRQERHYIIPVTRLQIHTHRIGDEESDDIPFVAYIFPYDNVTDWVCVDRKFIDGDTSKLEYFFTKLFKKSNL